MRHIPKYREEVNRLLAELEGEANSKPDSDTELPPPQEEDREPDGQQPEEIYDLYTIPYRGGKRGFIAIPADDEGIMYDSTLVTELDTEIPQGPAIQTTLEEDEQAAQVGEKTSRQAGLLTMSFFIFLCLACLAVQLHFIIDPPVATITIIPKSQTVTLSASLHIGRVLTPITLSQSQTVPTTGKGHQAAKQATGTITFYNGQLTQQFVPAGTILTSANGTPITTDQDASIPPADPTATPPIFGQVTVSAHAVNPGSRGNIPAYAINGPCCSSVIAKNLTSFTGGQDERNYQFVTKSDIENAAIPLKAALDQSVTAALQTQLKENEQLQLLPCAPQVSADHHISEEAALVKVTASLTCSGVAYYENTLQQQATQLLTQKALQALGSGYSEFGMIQATVIHATAIHTTPTLVLSLTGTWAYAIPDREQERIKRLITGRTYQDALRILRSLPGIERVSIAWDEHTKLPKDSRYIHLALITGI